MITQYPHIVQFELVTGSTTSRDGNGDTVIVPGTTTTIELKCRFEPNSKGETIITNDGKVLVYNWIVYMPLGQPGIPDKKFIKGYMEDGSPKGFGVVERFDRGQFNARAWV